MIQVTQTNPKYDVPEDGLARIAGSDWYGVLVALLIFANSIFIGVEVEVSMIEVLKYPPQRKPEFFSHVNHVFTAIFALELIINLISYRWSFLFGPGWQWNVFDAVLVLISAVDLVDQTSSNYSTGYIRLLRIARMARVLRIVRILRFSRNLRCIAMSMVSCLVPLVWSLLLMLMVVYIFAIIFMQAGINELQANRDEIDIWKRWYGSLGESVLSLTKAISGGDSWGLMLEPLESVDTGYTILFVVYIMMFIFGALNVLTGVFMQRALETMTHDRDWITQEETIKTETFIKNLSMLFREMDLDKSGEITWQEFLQAMENPSTAAFFTSHGLDLFDAHLVFNTVMASSKGDAVKLEDFLHGCSRASGYAKSAHLMALMRKVDTLHEDVQKAFVHLDSTLAVHELESSPSQPALLATAASPRSGQRHGVLPSDVGNQQPGWSKADKIVTRREVAV